MLYIYVLNITPYTFNCYTRAIHVLYILLYKPFSHSEIIFRCDCQPVVQALDKRSSASVDMMHLIRLLTTTAARHQFDFQVTHIAGVSNIAADALSRYDMIRFYEECPSASPLPTPILQCTLPRRSPPTHTSTSPSLPVRDGPTTPRGAAGINMRR